MGFTDRKPWTITEKDVTTKWGLSGDHRLHCYLCGKIAEVGDTFRWLYMNGASPSPGNVMCCSGCDHVGIEDEIRAALVAWQKDFPGCNYEIRPAMKLAALAAELRTLRARVAELEAEAEDEGECLNDVTLDFIDLKAECDRLRAELAAEGRVRTQLRGELTAANDTIAGLREALVEVRSHYPDDYKVRITEIIDSALTRTPAQHLARIVSAAIEEYIENHGIKCDCCQHVMIDVTAEKEGGRSHCMAGDPEGDGVACAHGMYADAERNEKRIVAAGLREEAGETVNQGEST